MRPWGCSASSTACSGHYYGDIPTPTSVRPLFDEMLRQDYQFGLFGALEDAKQYQAEPAAGLRKQVFVSRRQTGRPPADRRLAAVARHRTADRPWFSWSISRARGLSGARQPQGALPARADPASTRPPPTGRRTCRSWRIATRTRCSTPTSCWNRCSPQLQQQGSSEQTIVVITSNHGQEFNETQSNSWGYGSNYSPIRCRCPWCWPGRASRARSQEQASSHLDLVPTLMKGMLGYAIRLATTARGAACSMPARATGCWPGSERFRHLSGQHHHPVQQAG